MERSRLQAAHLFQRGLVPEQALRWALEQATSQRDPCEFLLERGWISPELAAEARDAAQRAGHNTQALPTRPHTETQPDHEVLQIPAGGPGDGAREPEPPASLRLSSDPLLADSSGWPSDHPDPPDEEPLPVTQLGPYRILRKLGQGGMGVVFLAEHTVLRRQVALKRIRPRTGIDSARALRRFEVEAQAMARLEHPHILRVLDIRVEGDSAYMIVALATGGSLADRLKRGSLTVEEALRLTEQMARALHHAHEHAIIHRDVKPDNVLFDGEGQALLTDFGLAKPLDESLSISRPGTMIGTLLYMAPEQVAALPVDARTDVYALGATLYEALCGRPPFVARTQQALIEAIVNASVSPPSKRRSGVPGAVDTIVARCLAKDRDDRYTSAAALAEDCRRFLANEPILAQPVSLTERIALWRRRNPVTAVVGVLVCVLLCLTVGGTSALRSQQRVADARAEADRQARLVRTVEANLARVTQAKSLAQAAEARALASSRALEGELAKGQHLSAQLLARAGQRRSAWAGYLSAAKAARASGAKSLSAELGAYDLWRRAPAGLLATHDVETRALAVASNVALVGRGRQVQLWDVTTGATRALAEHERAVSALALDEERGRWVSGDHAGRLLLGSLAGGDAFRLGQHGGRVRALALDAQGEWLLSAGDGDALYLWSLSRRALERSFHRGPVQRLAFVPGSKLFLIGLRDAVEVWDREAWRRVRSYKIPGHQLAVSPAGDRAAAGKDASVTLFDPRRSKTLATLRDDLGALRTLGFARNGQRLIALDERGKLVEWSVARRVVVARYGLVADGVRHACADQPLFGETTILAGDGEQLRAWRVRPGVEGAVRADRFSAATEANQLAVLARRARGDVLLYDPATDLVLAQRQHGAPVRVLAAHGDERCASGDARGVVRLWTWDDAAQPPSSEARPATRAWEAHAGEIRALAFSPDGRRLAVGSGVLTLGTLTLKPGAPAREALPGLPAGPMDELVLGPEGRLSARVGRERTRLEVRSLRVWATDGSLNAERVVGRLASLAWGGRGLWWAGQAGRFGTTRLASGEPLALATHPSSEVAGEGQEASRQAGPILLTGSGGAWIARGDSLERWSYDTRPQRAASTSMESQVIALASVDPHHFASLHADGVVVRDLTTGEASARLPWREALGDPITILTWPSERRWLLVGQRGLQRIELRALDERVQAEASLDAALKEHVAPDAQTTSLVAALAQEWLQANALTAAMAPTRLRLAVALGRGLFESAAVIAKARLSPGPAESGPARRSAQRIKALVPRALERLQARAEASRTVHAALRAEDVAAARKALPALDADSPAGAWAVAEALELGKKDQRVVSAYRKALILDPDGAPTRLTTTFLIARASRRIKQEAFDGALADLEAIGRSRVLVLGSPAVDLARLLLARGEPRRALQGLDRVTKRDPEATTYVGPRARVLMELGKPKAALAALDRLGGATREDPELLLLRARALSRLGDYGAAIELLRTLVLSDPPKAAPLRERARVLRGEDLIVRVDPGLGARRLYRRKPLGGYQSITRFQFDANHLALTIEDLDLGADPRRVSDLVSLEAQVVLARTTCRLLAGRPELPKTELLEGAVVCLRGALEGGLLDAWDALQDDDDVLASLRGHPAYEQLIRETADPRGGEGWTERKK